MNTSLVYCLVKLISTGMIPTTADRDMAELARRIVIHYTLQGTKLIKIDTLNNTKSYRTVIPLHFKNATLKQIHNAAHLGQKNTYDQLSKSFYWPGMKQDCYEFVRSCPTCQKRMKKAGRAPLQPITKIARPFHQVGIDVMGPLSTTPNGKRYIVLAIDHFTKYIEARALEDADAQSIAVFIHDDIICRHGVPAILTSDRGTEFVNELIRALTKTYRIHHITTTAYHPEGNGQTERANRTIKDILAKITPKSGHWDHYLSVALSATRYTRSESTHFSPFELLHGFSFPRALESTWPVFVDLSPTEYAEREFARITTIRRNAANFISRAQDRQKKNHDGNTKLLEPFKVGDTVKLLRSVVDASWSRKMEVKWDGPYSVQKVQGNSYKLRRPDGSIIPSTYHRNKLDVYHERPSLSPRPQVQKGPVIEITTRQRPQQVPKPSPSLADTRPRRPRIRSESGRSSHSRQGTQEQQGTPVPLSSRRNI
jgi:transposase InsO family protein